MEYGSNHLKPSDMWKDIKPRIGEMLTAVNDIETRYGKAVKAVDEAYQSGYEDGKGDSSNEDAYRRGLNDAWEAARTIFCTSHGELERIFDLEEDDNGLLWVYHEYTASEAIEKIRQYEQEKDKRARIKYNCEEIKDVINTTMKECNVSLDEIAEVLQKMKGLDNG